MSISSLRAESELYCFAAEHIPEVWGKVKPFIQNALDRGSRYTSSEIFDGLVASKMQLWTSYNGGIEAAMVTSLQGDYCLLLAAGGKNMNDWKRYLPVVEEWARECGVKEMRIYGRRGWAKVLGYTIDYTKMSKPL